MSLKNQKTPSKSYFLERRLPRPRSHWQGSHPLFLRRISPRGDLYHQLRARLPNPIHPLRPREVWLWQAHLGKFTLQPNQESALFLNDHDRLVILLSPAEKKIPLNPSFLAKNHSFPLIPFTEQILHYIEALSSDKQAPYLLLSIEKARP